MQSPAFDSHIHSLHSFDGEASIEALCLSALAAGLTGIAITDHCDLGRYRLPDYRERLAASLCDIHKTAQAFSDRLEVRAGIELGQPLHEPAISKEVLRNHFDVVLASVHNLRNTDDFYYLGSRAAGKRALLTHYFEELLEVVKLGDFDVLTHLTYPYCYLGYDTDTPPVTAFEEALRAIFSVLSQRGKSLEINTSRICRPGASGRAMPELWELSLYRACGGELVTLGSDAHHPTHVASGLMQGAALLRAAGFNQQVFYRDRTPVFFPLG